MSDQIGFDQFVSLLKRRVREKASVKLHMVTDDHHIVWVALRDGIIVSLFYGPKKGVAALGRMRSITGGSLNQNPELVFPDTPGLPATEEILRRLEQPGETRERPSVAAASVRESAPVPPGEVLDPARTERIVAELETLLQQHLGPIAAMVISRSRKRLGGIRDEVVLRRFVDGLVAEVAGIGDHEAFLREAKRIAGLA